MHRRARHLNPKAAGATLVLDARYITGLVDGNAVTTWNDLSGNGYNPTQATAGAKPTYKRPIQGGQPVVRFDGGDTLYYSANLSTVNALSIQVACSFNDNTSRLTAFDAKNSALSGTSFNSFVFEQMTTPAYGFYTSQNALPSNISPSAGWKIASIAADTTATGVITTATRFAINGVVGTLTTIGSNQYRDLTGRSGFMVGSFNNGGAPAFGYMNGDIASISAFPSKLSASLARRLDHAIAYSFKIACS